MKNFLNGQRIKIHFEREAGGKVERPIQGSLSIPKAGEILFRLESEWQGE